MLLRVDGAGKIEVVDFGKTTATKVMLPNSAQRVEGITDMAFADGKLYVAGLSNEEFASKLRSIPYPFASVRSRHERRDLPRHRTASSRRARPCYTFVPYRVQNTPHLIAGYLCTPLVKFPVASLKPGEKIMGTTIAELGAGNRPIDMVALQEGRAGLPADVEHPPRRDEDPDRAVRIGAGDHGARRTTRAASATRR